MTEPTSHRQILRSSSIIGGASVINILISLVRVKAAAVLLGPAGVGLLGLFQNMIATAAVLASLGFGSAGTRQIAVAVGEDDAVAIAMARRALFWGTLFLAVVGGAVFWLLRDPLARHVLGDPARAGDVGWLALGVSLSVAAASQGALLNGLRRVGDIARVSVAQSIVATLLGIGAVWVWGARGLLVLVLATPLATFIIGHLYVARLPKVDAPRTPINQLVGQWQVLAKLGAAFMVAGVVVLLGQLLVRSMVQRYLGAEALGQFQASWMISMTYIGFVLAAMGTDYFPRLSAAIQDRKTVNRMVNEQTDVALLLAGPVLLAMIAFAPWVIELLYSRDFSDAAVILRWQVLGDLLKVASWPLGFLILAAGDGRTFMLTETLTIFVFAGLVWLGLPLVGISMTGVAFLGMYLVYLPMMYWLARRRTGFHWSGDVRRHFFALCVAGAVLAVIASWHPLAGAGAGLVMSTAFAAYGLSRLGHKLQLAGPGGRVVAASQRFLRRVGLWHD